MSVYVAGHSLGAARAALYGFSRVARGLPLTGIFLFGCPNPGDGKIGAALSRAPVAIRNVRNRRDLVTDVPVDLPWLGEEYVQVAPFEETDEPGADGGPFRDHHIALYQAGCAKLPDGNVALSLNVAVTAVADLYGPGGDWAWEHFVDGQYWAVRTFPNGDRLAVARGSVTALDWLDDFDAVQETVLGARISAGFWTGVGPVEAALDAALA